MPVNDIDPLDLVDPARFARNGYPHHVWAKLRAEAPVAYIEPPGYPPFWAVTKHADIVQVASQPQLFSSAGGITLDMDLSGMESRAGDDRVPRSSATRSDAPDRQQEVPEECRAGPERGDQTDRRGDRRRAATGGEIGECDFVDTFAAPFPVAVISWVLGVPQSDWELHFRWTNEIIGKDDPEYRRPGESPEQTSMRARGELHRYFKHMIEQRREDPQDDLVTMLVQSEIDGVPLTRPQLVSYCELLVEAGNQTTRDAIAGGMQAFCEHPGTVGEVAGPAGVAARRRRRDPSLGHSHQLLLPHGHRGLRAARTEDPRRGQGRPVLGLGEPGRGRVRGSLRVPHRPSTGPTAGVRLRPPPLHGCPRGPGRAVSRCSAS